MTKLNQNLLCLLFQLYVLTSTDAQLFALHGSVSNPRQKLETQETEGTSQKSYFSTTATLKTFGLSVRLNKQLWATASYAKHREFIQYAAENGITGGESILKTINYYAGLYADIKLWRWIAIQPELLLNIAQYTQTWILQTNSYTVTTANENHQIIAKTIFIDPGWRIQPNPAFRLVVKPVKRIYLHLGFAYSFGTKKLQEWTAIYSKNGIKQKEAKTWINGSKYGLSLGASILLGKLK
jgi:hypothetical protein